MLFYIALALACVIAAMGCIWLCRMLIQAGSKTLGAVLPGAERRRRLRDDRLSRLNTSYARAPTPWGWGSHGKVAHSHAQPGWNRAVAASAQPAINGEWQETAGLRPSNQALIARGLENSAAVDSLRVGQAARDPFPVKRTDGDSLVNWGGRLHRSQPRPEPAPEPRSRWGWRKEPDSRAKTGGARKGKRERQEDTISMVGTSAKPWGW